MRPNSFQSKKSLLILVRRDYNSIWGLFTFPHVIAVSSTAVGLTSLFEMGRGEHYSYQPHKVFEYS